MKLILFLMVALSVTGCVQYNDYSAVQPNYGYYQPPRYYAPEPCVLVETPIYGYADIYRSGSQRISVREIVYSDRRC